MVREMYRLDTPILYRSSSVNRSRLPEDMVDDLPRITLAAIEHFFRSYKDLEPGKWVKIIGWVGRAEAEAAIEKAIAAAR
jgi:inorganic pyrophosphatase